MQDTVGRKFWSHLGTATDLHYDHCHIDRMSSYCPSAMHKIRIKLTLMDMTRVPFSLSLELCNDQLNAFEKFAGLMSLQTEQLTCCNLSFRTAAFAL